MKKRLFLLPLLAGFALAGCEFTIGGKTFVIGGGKDNGGNNSGKVDDGDDSGDDEDPIVLNIKEEFGSYKLARKVENGKKYLMGVYKVGNDEMRFANGDYHRDNKGFYPFYMGQTVNTTDGAAEFEVNFVNSDEFTMKVHAPDQVWDGKYVGVYPATSSYGNSVMTLALLDDPNQTTYVDPKSGNSIPAGTDIVSKFKYFESYNQVVTYAPAALYKYPDVDETAVPKFFGTGADYVSMDCTTYEKAFAPDDYFMAHFYEAK